MKKVLFIDRDGTLIWEPPNEQQIDSLEVLEFIPNVFRNLYDIQKYHDDELVMVTNQDGLGSVTFPEHTFWPAHEKMIKAFANEGVTFGNIHIDRTRPEDNAPTRKPGIGMLSQYFDGDYDLANSIVIGDRLTDVELAKNLGAKAILFDWNNLVAEMQQRNLYSYCLLSTTSWDEVFELLSNLNRKATVNKKKKKKK